ncbi:MAG: site-2 protease family protein [Acidobacteriota bacterium]|nr:site-2 protease family protein [Acidobacteriota bacterium]
MSGPWTEPAPGPGRRPQGPDRRTTIWVIAVVALLLVLVRTHHVSAFTVLVFAALIPSVIVHEVSHGVVALAFGDDTAKRAGRLTLNPVKHVDPFGTIILPAILAFSGSGSVFGWAKPVPVNVGKLRRPRNQNVAVALVGPAVNVVMAVVFALAYRYLVPVSAKFGPSGFFIPIDSQSTWVQLVFVAGYVNVILAVFNSIPLPPLDGSAVVERLLPARLLPGYYRIRPFTMFLPLLVVLLYPQALQHVFQPFLNEWARLLG